MRFYPKRSRKLRKLAPVLLAVGLLCLTWAVFYCVQAARLVTERMENKTWKLASKVYVSPTILYPGAKFSPADMQAYLAAFGYAKTDAKVPQTGQWRRDFNRFLIGHRAFHDANGDQAARVVAVRVDTGRVAGLAAFDPSGAESALDTLKLEPQLLGMISGDRLEDRALVALEDVPRRLRDGILAMEDRAFYEHSGLSYKGIARALLHNVFRRGGRQGGSTLTQQLMKNFFLTNERTWSRKIREALMTVVAEKLYSKDRILEAYVNEIYLGQNRAVAVHGFEQAAQFYFAKPLSATSLGEQAALVGLISSPGKFSPYNNLAAALERRAVVLRVLRDEGKITAEEFAAASKEKLEPRGRKDTQRAVPYFLDFVRSELEARFGAAALKEDGYAIFTTLDPLIQAAAQTAVQEGLAAIDAKVKAKNPGESAEAPPIQAAVIALQPHTGAVKAMIGGRDYALSQFNRVTQARRQPGSSVKPFVLARAFLPNAEGRPAATPSTLLVDEPATFSYAGQEWTPRNFQGKYFGKATVRNALQRSLNVAFVNLAAAVGLDDLSQFFTRLGFSHPVAVPSMAIGAMEATPLELARAYTIFPNEGLRADPISILSVFDARRQALELKSATLERVVPHEVAYMVTYLMQGVIDAGSGRAARAMGLTGEYAGKTGTTNDYKDNWFVGFSRDLLAVVWVGYDEPKSIGLTGSATALEIWTRFMKKVHRGDAPEPFFVPAGIEWEDVDPELGCAVRRKNTLREVFLSGTTPKKCP